ncbi:MAG: ornithine carbamoyltransferase [Candidatus Binatia bacterium]
MKRDLLSIADLSRSDIEAIFALARTLKRALAAGRPHQRLAGRGAAMIFEKPSLRTRVTFEIGISQLGGSAVYLAPGDIRLGERESVADIARNLARWVDLIVARTFSHDVLVELARNATVPVVNALSDREHPCQVLADCFTLIEKRKRLAGLKVAFVGDGNNMVHSLMLAATRLGIDFRLACPGGYEPDGALVSEARRSTKGRVTITHSVAEAVAGADVLYTDVWTSMGQEAEVASRREAFRGYQLNDETLALAKPGALVMHCLPAHRGDEITDSVLDGPQSIVLDQAENRLHVQKAIMVWLASFARRGRGGPSRRKRTR